MGSLKQEAVKIMSALPENVDMEEIMCRLHVIGKVRKRESAVREGKTMSSEDLIKEIASW